MAPRPQPPRTVLALCAGIGGLEQGAAQAVATLGGQLRCVGIVERGAYPAAVLVARMADKTVDPAPVWDDLTTFDGQAFRDRVDLVTAGYPCQPFSVAGERRGVEDERWLWNDVWRVVGDVGPGYLFVENVPGHLSKGFDVVLGSLAARGWVAEWDVVSAASVGAPHLRERLFCLAADPERVAIWFEQGRRSRPGRSGEVVADASGVARTSSDNNINRLQGLGCSHVFDSERAPQRDNAHGRGGAGADDAEHRRTWDWGEAPEPAFCRMDDELSDRLDRDWADRIHALGNAVVPAAAARAFLTLWDRLHDEALGPVWW